jgi:hypothetical protein
VTLSAVTAAACLAVTNGCAALAHMPRTGANARAQAATAALLSAHCALPAAVFLLSGPRCTRHWLVQNATAGGVILASAAVALFAIPVMQLT